MFRKIFIFLLIGVSLQNTEVEATGDVLSAFLTTPLNLASGALSFASDAVRNAFDIASILKNAGIDHLDSMANSILKYSHDMAQYFLSGMDVSLEILKDASTEIRLSLSRFYTSIAYARDQLSERLTGIEKNLVHDSIKDVKQFILELIQSGQVMLGPTIQKYEDVTKSICSLAKDLIDEAKNNKDDNKTAVLEDISENIKKLQDEIIELRENFSHVAKNAIDELNNMPETELIETKIKVVITALTNVWSKTKQNIENMQKQFDKIVEAGGDVSEDIKSRFDNCRKQFEEINENLHNFIEQVKLSANKRINDIVDVSKKGVAMFFNSSIDAVFNSLSGVESLIGNTIGLIGDFMKDRMTSISEAKQHVCDSLNDVKKVTGDTLDKLTNIAEDFKLKIETASSGILEMTLSRFIQVITTVDESIKKGDNAIRIAINQTMDFVDIAKTEISTGIQNDIKHIQSTYNSVTETIRSIAAGVTESLKNVAANIRNVFVETIKTTQVSISNKINIFNSIVTHGVSGARRLGAYISSNLRKFQTSLMAVLAHFSNETQLKISTGIEAIKNLSDEFLRHLQSRYIQGSKKYLECSMEARKNLQDKMPSLMEKVHSCGKEGIISVVQTIDAALGLEQGMSPKVEQLLKSYEECMRGKILGITCAINLPVDRVLGLFHALEDVLHGTAEATAKMALCKAQYIEDTKNYFAQLREEFDKCIKQE